MGVRSLAVLGLVVLIAQGCRVGSDPVSDTSIIGGRAADYHPFMVAIRDAKGNAHFCGGSWIDEGVILTAAHCLYGETAKLSVTVGATRQDDVRQGNTFKVRGAVLHPDYNPDRDMKNDIALLFVESVDHSRLPRPIAPIKLNVERSFPAAGDLVTPIGWGNQTSYGMSFGNELQQVDVPVVANAVCRQGGEYYDLIEDDFEICAGSVDRGGVDACQGDSGGPLIANVNGEAVLVGIVSWGVECAQKNRPGVYTRVSKHVDWIKSEIAANKQPAALDASFLIKTVTTHCYSGFMGTERRSGQTYSFRYQLDTLEKVDTAPVHDRALNSCSFSPPNLGVVNVVVAPLNGKAHFFVTVGGETWFGPAKSQFELEAECTEQDYDFAVYKSFDSLFLSYNDKRFVAVAISSPSDSIPSERVTCKDQHVDLTYDVYGNGTSKKRYVTVSFPKVAEEPVTYLLQDFTDTSSVDAGVLLLHDFVEPTKANVEFKQQGNVDIFTWRLDCPFKYHLVAEGGEVFRPEDGRPNFYSVSFKHGSHSQAVIERGQGVKFVMEFDAPATPEKLRMCSINGIALDVD